MAKVIVLEDDLSQRVTIDACIYARWYEMAIAMVLRKNVIGIEYNNTLPDNLKRLVIVFKHHGNGRN